MKLPLYLDYLVSRETKPLVILEEEKIEIIKIENWGKDIAQWFSEVIVFTANF